MAESAHSHSSSGATLANDAHTADPLDDNNRDNERIRELARQISYPASQHSKSPVVNPFLDSSDPKLDPNSKEFSSHAWLKRIVQLRESVDYPNRTAGVSYTNLNVHGFGSPTDYQKNVGNVWLGMVSTVKRWMGMKNSKMQKIQILKDFEGLVKSGELLVVLGRPGSGCSTFLKTIAGDTHGFHVDKESRLEYQGISAKMMKEHFRGEVIYTAETDVHFPHLTVGQTLTFAAKARAPRNRPGVTRDQYAEHMRDVVMAAFGLSHTLNTKVGNDFVRGVSGGERKRVSITESILSGSPLQCWDNSTRGLDSATALEFIRYLKLSTTLTGATALVAIYQASQSAYDLFDKVVVLYKGRQIYFGPTQSAKKYFTEMGFVCADRQTTGDFLTSLTNPAERIVAPGFEGRVPRTPDEFANAWKESSERKALLQDIQAYTEEFPVGGAALDKFRASRTAAQSKSLRPSSPYTISVRRQIQLCIIRGYQRMQGDRSTVISTIFGNAGMALIISSVFYNQKPDTSSFFTRGSLLFYAVLMNAFASALEMMTLYAQRPIVEKHAKYALYHAYSEAIASMIVDMPIKLITAVTFNLILYFMTNLRREPGAFFTFFVFSFTITLVMSNVFRTIAAGSRSLVQALVPAALFILILIIYTGFTIPISYMVVWFRWLNYLDPLAYAFESLMVNEFHGRTFACAAYLPTGPGYENVSATQRICSTVGAVAGSNVVDGDTFVRSAYGYEHGHLWRNYGIIVAYFVFFLATYIGATEYIQAARSKGEVLLFRRGHLPHVEDDEEAVTDKSAEPFGGKDTTAAIQRQTKIFQWKNVVYDIKIQKEDRRILDHISGWVKPGQLTALMGVSGAGKTTLLDVLATRTTMGVITGEMLVNGHPRDESFQRKTGYVQQQDLHLATSTVREALTFSALLRQSHKIPREEKIAYVEEVIIMLEMEDYAEAIVGVPGEGLNVEQRKRLTIGVELAAKPELLLFFDEPTSGLDSQTAWSICQLMRKLANNGQAILCTIHQPSAILMQEFDRLLFLAKGGRVVYFDDIGKNSTKLTSYFEKNGAHPCPPDANPAEWMLEVIGAAPGSHTDIDWPAVWRESPEQKAVLEELDKMKAELYQIVDTEESPAGRGTFAIPLGEQIKECTKRVWQQYYRTPAYVYSKIVLSTLTALFISFSFYKADNSIQGLQNQLFGVFMLMTVFGNLTQQIMPMFVTQRALYEARERPSKAYSWVAFILAQIFVEMPWQILTATIVFFSWYYPIGLYRNAIPTDAVAERGALVYLYVLSFYLYTSTFAHMVISSVEYAENGGNIANLIFSFSLIFCGVLVQPQNLGWWIWMNYVSPFTYLISGILATSVGNTNLVCAANEYLKVDPPSGQSCKEYFTNYLAFAGTGYLQNPDATSACSFCPASETNAFLSGVGIKYDNRWRNFGIIWVYIVANIFGALFFYWLVRVPKDRKEEDTAPAGAVKSIAATGSTEKIDEKPVV